MLQHLLSRIKVRLALIRVFPLILFVEACVKTIFESGRKFPWPRPDRCPCCQGRIWAHGFATAYFDDYPEPLWIRRYRCVDCRTVFRTRPSGYWSRFQAAIATIREHIAHRLTERRWKPDLPRSRQRHWLDGLRKQILTHFGAGFSNDPLQAFDSLMARGVCAASRAI